MRRIAGPKVNADRFSSYGSGYFRGKEAERERIIKLLETECCELIDCRCSMRITWAIALIKEENE